MSETQTGQPLEIKSTSSRLRSRLQADFILLFVAAVWGSGFVAQRIASADMGNFMFNGIRFLLGAIFLLPLVKFRVKIKKKDLGWVILAGVLLFGGATLQQVGIKTTTAGNAGFITGLYVVIIPILLVVFGRQRIHWATWIAVIMAVAGIFLLSTSGKLSLAPGDDYVLVGAFVWALHVITVGVMARRMDTLQFTIGQFMVCGLLNLFLGIGIDLPAFNNNGSAWLAVLYSTVFPVALGFTLQVSGQKHAPATDAAIILSMEAVFAALFGFLFLQETMQPIQFLGCVLILAAILLAQMRVDKKSI